MVWCWFLWEVILIEALQNRGRAMLPAIRSTKYSTSLSLMQWVEAPCRRSKDKEKNDTASLDGEVEEKMSWEWRGARGFSLTILVMSQDFTETLTIMRKILAPKARETARRTSSFLQHTPQKRQWCRRRYCSRNSSRDYPLHQGLLLKKKKKTVP